MDLQDLILTNLGAIIVGVVGVIYSFARLEVKVGTLIKDVDNIALIVGTKRAIETKQKKDEVENAKLGSTL